MKTGEESLRQARNGSVKIAGQNRMMEDISLREKRRAQQNNLPRLRRSRVLLRGDAGLDG
jgi:hypothetical protein